MVTLLKGITLNEELVPEIRFDVGDKHKFFISKAEDKADYYSNLVMLIYGLNKKVFSQLKYSLIDFSKDVKDGI